MATDRLPALTILILIVLLCNTLANAQSVRNLCGTPEPASLTPLLPAERNQCFTVSEIQDNCTKLWLKVNIHFFLDDHCEGSLHPLNVEDIPMKDAYMVAEKMVEEANEGLEENRKQWQQLHWGISPEKPPQCVPFRYALSGVYVHCNTQARNTSGTSGSLNNYFQPNFGINTESEFNVYCVEYQGGPNGAANGIPGNAFSTESLYDSGIFNHEMGHVLDLEHSWEEDGIEDTPPISFTYDYNCDGDLNDYWGSGVGGEYQSRQCWDVYCNPDLGCTEPNPMDYDGDNQVDIANPCERPEPCTDYPCCSWAYVNNNIMAYSRYLLCCAAFTEGQITKILERLSTEEYCSYIEEITNDICLPPMANLHVLPTEFSEEDCSFCFQPGASMHDKYYKLDFYTPTGGLQHSTGWKDGPAKTFCISYYFINPGVYKYGFQPGVEYTAELTVENDCGDEQMETLTFILPELPANCGEIEQEDKIKVRALSPVLADNKVAFQLPRGPKTQRWEVYSVQGRLMASGIAMPDKIPLENWASGIYFVRVQVAGGILYAGKFVK